jgi:hypothetical protein
MRENYAPANATGEAPRSDRGMRSAEGVGKTAQFDLKATLSDSIMAQFGAAGL